MKNREDMPEEEYLRRGMDAGWVTLQTITMNLIVIDQRFQNRVEQLDMNHVRTLSKIRDDNEGAYLHPIVVFLLPDGRFLLVDGRHRYSENSRRRETSVAIPARIVDHGDNWEREAFLFASMCNQRTILVRSHADKQKAIEMVLGLSGCEEWTDQKIAIHCGVVPATVSRVRREFAIKSGRDLPPRPLRVRKNQPSLVLAPGGEHEPEDLAHPPIGTTRAFKDWLLDHGIMVDMPNYQGASFRLHGLIKGDRVIVLCNSLEVEGLYAAIGKVFILREMNEGTRRCIVVTVEQDGTPQRRICELSRRFSVEFMTPRELVQDIKATSNGEDHAAQEKPGD